MKTLESYVASRKLELLRAGTVDGGRFVNVPPLGFSEVRTYSRPANPKQGRKYETTVLIGLFPDGSFSAFEESD